MTTDGFKSYNSHATPKQLPGQKNHNHFEAVPLWRMHPPAPEAGATSVPQNQPIQESTTVNLKEKFKKIKHLESFGTWMVSMVVSDGHCC